MSFSAPAVTRPDHAQHPYPYRREGGGFQRFFDYACHPGFDLTLPETGFLRQPQVLAFVPISKSTLWRRIQARTFPEPVKLSERVTVWRAEDIRRWIAQQGQRG